MRIPAGVHEEWMERLLPFFFSSTVLFVHDRFPIVSAGMPFLSAGN
jgi:dolichyl-phosphate-mannose--protein O-mannosyl transferase